MGTRRQMLLATASMACVSGSSSVRAQAQWPNAKVVRIVVPYPPGSSMDVMGRLIGEKVAQRWNQSVIVDNRAGASGSIGGEFVGNAEPDGSTLLLPSMSIATNRYLYPSMKWDPLKELRPVILICRIPNVMVVHADSPCLTVDDFIKLARAHPGSLNYGSAGAGTSMHLGAELFMRATGIRMTHVPYRGSTPAMQDLIAGTIHVMFATLSSALGHIRAGQVRALGVTTSTRSASAPDIPTIAESGVPGFEMSAWYGIMAPAKTPEAIVERMNQDMRWALADPAIRHQLENSLGMHVVASTREEFGAFLARESSRWGALITSAGIQLE